MIWANNMDEGLNVEKKIRKRNANKTTRKSVSLPNGITEDALKRRKSKIPVLKKVPIPRNSTVNVIAITTQKSVDEKGEKKISKSAIALFADRVAMAGVEDAYKAKIMLERWMWYIALIAATSMAIFTAANIAKKYFHPQTIYDYYPIINIQPPFPNVSLCAPFTIDKSQFVQYLTIPDHTLSLIKRKQLDLRAIIDYTLEFWRYDQYPRTINSKNQLVAQASFEIMKATEARFRNGYAELISRTTPKCEDVLSNCSFHDSRFDCCEVARQIWTFDMTCFLIDVNQIPKFVNTTLAAGGDADDTLKLETSGLVVNASFDWKMASYFEDTAKDGFQLTLGHIMSSSESPASVPSGADALVTIGTTKLEELTNCVPNNNIPGLKYFDYYDPYGTLAFIEHTAVGDLINIVGCDIPYLTHYLTNESLVPSCPVEVPAFLKVYTSFVDEVQLSQGIDLKSFDINKIGVDTFRESLPLCNRWEYHIATASYGYVHYRDQTDWDLPRNDEGKAWSRIRIFFPSSSFLHRVEQPPSPAYVAMCDVGGSMGLYIGVSIISFVQIFVYGIFVFYSVFAKYCKRKNKVAPQ